HLHHLHSFPTRRSSDLAQAREQWDILRGAGAKLHTSIPVVIETFTFLDRNANRDVALTWKQSIYKPGIVKILPCELRDLQQSWRSEEHTSELQSRFDLV